MTVPRAQGHPAVSPRALTIVRQVGNDTVTLVLSGEIDLESASTLENELRDAESSLPRRIVLDLAGLDFLDSTGIHLLFDAQQRADTSGHRLVLRHVPAHAHRLFALTGLSSRLAVE